MLPLAFLCSPLRGREFVAKTNKNKKRPGLKRRKKEERFSQREKRRELSADDLVTLARPLPKLHDLEFGPSLSLCAAAMRSFVLIFALMAVSCATSVTAQGWCDAMPR